MKLNKKDLILYAVTDSRLLNGRRLYEDVKKSLEGGVTLVQLREKSLNDADFFKEAKEIKELCREYNVPFIINDNVDIAVRANADGVHVGQNDMNAFEVRKKIGTDKILGVSVQTVEQAVLAQQQGADYLGAGAVFPTGSKDDAESVSIETLKRICAAVSVPVVAIGGITKENISSLTGSGICGIAVISAVYAQTDIKAAAHELKEKAERMIEK